MYLFMRSAWCPECVCNHLHKVMRGESGNGYVVMCTKCGNILPTEVGNLRVPSQSEEDLFKGTYREVLDHSRANGDAEGFAPETIVLFGMSVVINKLTSTGVTLTVIGQWMQEVNAEVNAAKP